MAQSRSGFSPEKLFYVLPPLEGVRCLWVGYSGGCDSHVLLHALAALRDRLGVALKAVHVDHGLQADSVRWARHCEAVCRALDIEYVGLRVDAAAQEGESREAAARQARYEAIEKLLGSDDRLCTAHHRDDQAETLLLQLCRGAGPKGLAAMPVQGRWGRLRLFRPLLSFGREELRRYGCDQGLRWIEDPSNADTSLARNYLRHQLMPLFRRHWPGVVQAICRSARHCGEAAQLMDDLAAIDMAAVAGSQADTLVIEPLLQLTPVRRKNVIRHWLAELGFSLPSEAKMQHLLDDVLMSRADAMPCVAWAGVEVRRFQGRLYGLKPAPAFAADCVIPWDMEGSVELPDGSVVEVCQGSQKGLSLDEKRLRQARLTLRFRQGGESIKPWGSDHHRTLKKLFQEREVPPWLRSRQPLLYAGEVLIAVVGLCVNAEWAAPEGGRGVVLSWRL